jgi:hypothetical protein
MRDGEHVREPVDALVRGALARAGIGYAVIGGMGVQRSEGALAAVRAARRPRPSGGRAWRWACEHCDDGTCERHLHGLLRPGST